MKHSFKSWIKVPALAAFLVATAPSAWAGTVFVRIQPPDIRVETHEERRGYIWQSGYWRWRGNRHDWQAGHFAREKHGQRWSDGRWEHGDHGYFWVNGRWGR